MTDEELRALVRSAIARHLGPAAGSAVAAIGGGGCPPAGRPASTPPGHPVAVPLWRSHPSFGRLLVPRGDEEDGPCIIEPSVHCNHCGFCQSYGH